MPAISEYPLIPVLTAVCKYNHALLMCVTLLIAINERVRDYRATPVITTANTIINGVQKQKQQLAMEQLVKDGPFYTMDRG